ncbi:FecR family protein [Achromobacter sp.]|uniref:FecR family protein n=1 Tax=Achromobacter sp. TaxID=134375 RepID=UPI002F9452A1
MNSDHNPVLDPALEREAHAWARALATGSPTTRDGDAFKAWRAQSEAHERAWLRAALAWRELGQVAHAYVAHRPGRVEARSTPAKPGRRWLLAAGGGAFASMAAVALLRPPFGLWPSWAQASADYRTVTGEQRNIEIAEQQLKLALNTQTSINVTTGVEPRIELVSGEAAIQATRSQPCAVLAGQARMRLTSGDIEVRRLRGDRVHLRCNSGQVELQHPKATLLLQAGQQLGYSADTLDAPAAIMQTASDWRGGIVSFRDLPLNLAVEEINRYRPGRVVLMNDSLARHRLSARYEVKNLDQAIAQIQQLYGVSVRRVGEVVFLS